MLARVSQNVYPPRGTDSEQKRCRWLRAMKPTVKRAKLMLQYNIPKMYASTNIIRIIKTITMKWAQHVACME
jgi:hypothetical protein